MTNENTSTMVEYVAPFDVPRTLARITEAVTKAGLKVFAQVDHAEEAKAYGLSMPPTTVLIYGHPKGGTPLMLAAPHIALDLPLRVLVRQRDDGQTVMAFHPARAMLRSAGLSEELVGKLDAAQQILVYSLLS